MKDSATIDQIQYVFTFPFKDEHWPRKLGIAFLLYAAGFILPIIPWVFVAGYITRIIRQGIEGDDFSLPEWDDWSDLFIQGLQFTGLGLIAFLPLVLIFGSGYLAFFLPAFAGTFASHPYGGSTSVIADLLPMLGILGGSFLIGLGVILGLVLGVVFPPAVAHIFAEEQFSAAFRVREWWQVFRANLGGYLISYVLMMGTGYLLMFFVQVMYMTIVLCLLLPVAISLVSVYLGIFMGAVFGQTYRVGRQNSALGFMPHEIASEGKSS